MYSYTDKIIVGCTVAIALALYPGAANLGFSQTVNAQTSTSHRLLEDEGKPKVDTDYSLRSGVTVKKALENISKKENLILSYDSDLLESTDEISVTDISNDNTIDKVLREVLSDTELEYKILKTRHLVIYDRGKVGHLKGKVVDNDNWDYLKDAKLYLMKADADSTGEEDVEKVTYVDSTGRYDINNVEEGTYRLVVILDGYKQVSKMIEIQNKQTTQKIIELERNK